MKPLVVAHLYYDLLNLYGEKGNIEALTYQLEQQKTNYILKKLSINDELNFNEYDFVYIGCGTEKNQKIVLTHLLNYKEQIKDYIESNKIFLATGNAIDLFGTKIIDINGEEIETLNIFSYNVKRITHSLVADCFFKCNLFNDEVLGFENRRSIIENFSNKNLFSIKKGYGYDGKNRLEGIKYKNFYATYLVAPILVRNPNMMKYFLNHLITLDKKKMKLSLDKKAYEEYISNNYFYK